MTIDKVIASDATSREVAKTGIVELDYVLGGGFPRDGVYLVEGDPGAGKTTLAMQFALAGAARGERVLYVLLSESESDVRLVAASHGWDDSQLHYFAPSGEEEGLIGTEPDGDVFRPSELELHLLVQGIVRKIEEFQPQRMVIDSLAELRYLSQTALRYRRQLTALKRLMRRTRCTAMFLDDRLDDPDLQMQSSARGSLRLEQSAPKYGRVRRRLTAVKMRGQQCRTGYHDFVIQRGGLRVFPRLIASEHRRDYLDEVRPTGMAEFDGMLRGGLRRGSSTMLIGSPGTGKSVLGAALLAAACRRGENVVAYVFDETAATFMTQGEELGLELQAHRASGRLLLRQLDPAEQTPGEFAWTLRRDVEENDATLALIDSLNGYFNSMPSERYMKGQMHELLSYLNYRGVTSVVTVSQHGTIGEHDFHRLDASYLADVIILLRFFEFSGEVRKALSVLKKRTGGHETAIREYAIDHMGLRIGKPLREFEAVLSGQPRYAGDAGPLLKGRDGG